MLFEEDNSGFEGIADCMMENKPSKCCVLSQAVQHKVESTRRQAIACGLTGVTNVL